MNWERERETNKILGSQKENFHTEYFIDYGDDDHCSRFLCVFFCNEFCLCSDILEPMRISIQLLFKELDLIFKFVNPELYMDQSVSGNRKSEKNEKNVKYQMGKNRNIY